MTRERHVRFYEGPGVRLPRSTHLACAAERIRRVTVECAQRRPTRNRELAQRPARTKTAHRAVRNSPMSGQGGILMR